MLARPGRGKSVDAGRPGREGKRAAEPVGKRETAGPTRQEVWTDAAPGKRCGDDGSSERLERAGGSSRALRARAARRKCRKRPRVHPGWMGSRVEPDRLRRRDRRPVLFRPAEILKPAAEAR